MTAPYTHEKRSREALHNTTVQLCSFGMQAEPEPVWAGFVLFKTSQFRLNCRTMVAQDFTHVVRNSTKLNQNCLNLRFNKLKSI